MSLDPNLDNPDAFYASLIAANERLTENQSFDFLIRLVMLLANQLGDAVLIQSCVDEARKHRNEQPQEIACV
jgi:Protein of unknown function (DUF2783)